MESNRISSRVEETMRKLLIISLLFLSVAVSAQIDWEKTSINVGGALASVALEMTGDALYDMGKESGNKSQMQWGHTLQAAGYVVPLVSIPFLVKDSQNKTIADVAIIVGTYSLMRFATADLDYNLTRGLDPLYSGVVTEYDNIMSKMPPDGKVIYKTFSFTLGLSINIKYW